MVSNSKCSYVNICQNYATEKCIFRWRIREEEQISGNLSEKTGSIVCSAEILCVPICPLQFLISKIVMTVFSFLHITETCEVLRNNVHSIGINIFGILIFQGF